MTPAVLVLLLCLGASVLAAIHQMVCAQDVTKTSKCDVSFGIPIVFLLAVGCGVSGLAVLATSHGAGNSTA